MTDATNAEYVTVSTTDELARLNAQLMLILAPIAREASDD